MAPALESCTDGRKSKPIPWQLRKPVVEKMRRDRINRSIKQLRILLESEIQSRQPNAKVEKADVLEIAVSYLKQRTCLVTVTTSTTKSPSSDFGQGYTRCLEGTLQYLSYSERMGHVNQEVRQYFHTAGSRSHNASPPAYELPSKHVIWRPW